MASWIFDLSRILVLLDNFQKAARPEDLTSARVRNPSVFLGHVIGYFTPYPGTVPFPSFWNLEEETADGFLGLWSGSGEQLSILVVSAV